jgi:phage-related protein
MVNVVFTLEGANGDTITFDDSEFVIETGILGFGIAATNVRIEDSAGDGGIFRNSKRLVREVDLPVRIFGSDRLDVEAKLRRLNKILQDGRGAPRLRASYEDATSLVLEVHYLAGGETLWDNSESGQTFARWVLQLRAPNPFWISGVSETFVLGEGSTGRGLLPELTKLKLSSSTLLGTVVAINAGDVIAFPKWELRGPINNLRITAGGQSFGFAAIAGGETIFVDTETATVTNDLGANLYARLEPAPKLFVLQPGTTTIQVEGEAITQDFSVRLNYSPRFEVLH